MRKMGTGSCRRPYRGAPSCLRVPRSTSTSTSACRPVLRERGGGEEPQTPVPYSFEREAMLTPYSEAEREGRGRRAGGREAEAVATTSLATATLNNLSRGEDLLRGNPAHPAVHKKLGRMSQNVFVAMKVDRVRKAQDDIGRGLEDFIRSDGDTGEGFWCTGQHKATARPGGFRGTSKEGKREPGSKLQRREE
ncbi:hypothetical protein B0H14DRAFT_2629562 [Mycena olivaceomarginata]|nr:hypothetical protein B0H14DRAFT_2629562 [Mycena olivaceomarginata]